MSPTHAYPPARRAPLATCAVVTAAFCVAVPVEGQQGPLPSIAVGEFTADGFGPQYDWIGSSFADAVAGTLSNSRAFRVVERSFLDRVVEELRLQQSGLVDPSTAGELGRLIGANAMVVGTVAGTDTEVLARARIIDVETAEVLEAVEASGPAASLLRLQRELGRRVASAFSVHVTVDDGAAGLVEMGLADLHRLSALLASVEPLPVFGLYPRRRSQSATIAQAAALAAELAEAYPRSAEVHAAWALAALNLGSEDLADRASAVAVAADPASTYSRLVRANALNEMGRPDEALEVLGSAPGSDARIPYMQGRILLDQDRVIEGIESLFLAYLATPTVDGVDKTLESYLSGSTGRARLRDLEEAESSFAQLGKLFVAMMNEDLDLMSFLGPQIQEAFPSSHLGYLASAKVHLTRGDPRTATELAAVAVNRTPDSADGHRVWSLALYRLGNCREAQQHESIYLDLSAFIDDFDAFDEARQACSSRDEANRGHPAPPPSSGGHLES